MLIESGRNGPLRPWLLSVQNAPPEVLLSTPEKGVAAYRTPGTLGSATKALILPPSGPPVVHLPTSAEAGLIASSDKRNVAAPSSRRIGNWDGREVGVRGAAVAICVGGAERRACIGHPFLRLVAP